MNFKLSALLFSLLILCGSVEAKIDLDFSDTRGLYFSSFQLSIVADDPSATIRYTTDSSWPSSSSGTVYNGPINITSTTIIRAYAYSVSDESNVKTHSYIYIQDVPSQQDTNGDFPYSVDMSNSIVQDATYINDLDDAFQDIPIMSLSLDFPDYNYIYNNKGIEVQANIEYINDKEGDDHAQLCGVNTYGNSTFSNANANKKNYRLKFKSDFGETKFDYPIFGNNMGVAEEFDILDLRAGGQETVDRGGVQNMHEQLMKNWQIAISDEGVHGDFTHLFINGAYWGVYTLCERPENSYAETYFGGDKDDYNTIKSTCCNNEPAAIDGNVNSYNTMISQTNYNTLENYLDVQQFIEYVLVCNYGPHGDWTAWNTYAFDNPTIGLPFKFYVWDVEPSLLNDWYYTNYIVDTRPLNNYTPMWDAMKTNSDFRTRVGDALQCNCVEDDGVLHHTNAQDSYDELYFANSRAYMLEAARWAQKSLYLDFLDYRNELISNNWFQNRRTDMINAYKSENLYPSIDAVEFSQYGGLVNAGSSITLTNPNGAGTIYYTTDGTDPRSSGGSISGSAINYNNSINLSAGVYEIKARVKNGTVWSAMCPRTFYVDQDYQDLVINEIHYNPEDSIYFNPAINAMDTTSGRNFEFVELKNTGNSIIYLRDIHFSKGISVKLEQTLSIPADGFLVIAEDAYWFEQKYGFAPDAVYAGKLDNGGENLWLLDPMENIIDTLRYDDNLPWDTIPDNGLYSLALIDASMNNTLSSNWSAQVVEVTPKAENQFCTAFTFSNSVSNPQCFGVNDGTASVTASGGNGPYSYFWSHGPVGSSVNGLPPGSYSVTVTDSNGCPDIETITIQVPPAAIAIGTSKTDPLCSGVDDGTASASASGGSPGYSYSWSNGANSSNISNLAPGIYTVIVTDGNGCQKSETVNIASPPSALSLNITGTDEICAGDNNGTASVSASGGAGAYSYSWSNGATSSSTAGLSVGTHTVTVDDANGCVSTEQFVVEALELPAAIAIITHPSCSGAADGQISFIWTDTGAPRAQIEFSMTGANGSYSSKAYPDESFTAFTNLAPGTYDLWVRWGNEDCPVDIPDVTLVDPADIVTTSSVNIPSVLGASDGSISLSLTGPAAASFSWSNGATTQNISGLIAGTYSVDITDVNGCVTSESITLNPGPQLPVASASFTPNNSVAPINVSFNAIGSTDPDGTIVGYAWDFGDGNTGSGAIPTHNFSAPGLYTVTLVVTDSQGLTDTVVLSVNVIDSCDPPTNLTLISASSNTLIVNWQGDPQATSYNLRYRDASIGGSWTNFPTAGTTAIITGLNDCTDYEVKVSNQCAFNLQSGFSSTEIFSTTNCFVCTAPLGLYQFNIQNISAIITWDVLVGATSYTYKFRKVGDLNWISQTTTFPIAVLFGISGCTDYEWTMETTCYDGSTAQSSTINNFSTLCKVDEDEKTPSSAEIILYPNPVMQNLMLRIPYISSESHLKIQNQNGQTVQEIEITKDLENSELGIDVSNLSSGIYYIHFDGRVASFVKL